MKPRRKLTLAALTVCAFFLQQAHTQNEPEVQTSDTETKILESLVSNINRDERLNAAGLLGRQRRELIGKLVTILNSTNSDNVKADVVIVLGEYQASEAVPFLVRHLEWDDVSHGSIFNGRSADEEVVKAIPKPISVALEKIGMPAVPALMDKITETDDAKILEKCVSICQIIEGSEVTQFRLQGLLDKETDSKKDERIQSALGALKKLNPVK